MAAVPALAVEGLPDPGPVEAAVAASAPGLVQQTVVEGEAEQLGRVVTSAIVAGVRSAEHWGGGSDRCKINIVFYRYVSIIPIYTCM